MCRDYAIRLTLLPNAPLLFFVAAGARVQETDGGNKTQSRMNSAAPGGSRRVGLLPSPAGFMGVDPGPATVGKVTSGGREPIRSKQQSGVWSCLRMDCRMIEKKSCLMGNVNVL